jgi:ABC-type multidrug transport system fused ATPase/permease subunit
MAGIRVLRAFRAANPRVTAAVLATAAVSGLLVPVFAVATGVLVRDLRGGSSVVAPVVVLFAAFVAGRLIDPARELLGEALWRQTDEWLSRRLMRAMSGPPGIAQVESPEVRDQVAQTEGLVTGVTPGEAGWWLGPVTLLWVQGGASLVIVAVYRWWLALALAAAYALAYRVSRRHWHDVTLVLMGRTPRLRRAYYVRTLALTPQVAKETRVFGLADWLVERYRQGWLAEMRDIWRTRREGWVATAAAAAAAGAVELGAIALVVRDAHGGGVSVAAALVVVQAVLGAGAITRYDDGNWYLSELGRVLDRVELVEDPDATPGGLRSGGSRAADGLPRTAIRFENVTFTYPGGAERVFDGLDLEIAAGQSLAIVGENGAGKTTLIKLLTRLYDPDGGRITVDGIDLRELAPDAWHRRVGCVFQDYVQFETSAYDNVAFGNLLRRDDREQVLEAARLAGADTAVERLPDGWTTVLTREVSGGADLSGGEWQRLALARALFAVRTGAGLLILDEPTASLDVRGEAQVYARFLELTRGVTTIVVSHRFSTVRRADRIVVVEHGRVLEDGSHEELLAAGGRYATMYELQAAKFAA